MKRMTNINRRDFLEITGVSAGLLVLPPFSGCSGDDPHVLVPQKIYDSAYLTKLSEDVKAMLRPDLTNVNKSILAALEGYKVRISLPALHDNHTHTSLYISFKNAISFWDVKDKADAMSTIEKQPQNELTLILNLVSHLA